MKLGGLSLGATSLAAAENSLAAKVTRAVIGTAGQGSTIDEPRLQEKNTYFAGITESELREYARKCGFCGIYGDAYGGVGNRSYSVASFLLTDKYISRDIVDPTTNEPIARADLIVAVTMDAARKPKLILVPVQLEMANNPGVNIFRGDMADRAVAGYPGTFPPDKWSDGLHDMADVIKVMANTYANTIFPLDDSHFEFVEPARESVAIALMGTSDYQDRILQLAITQGSSIENNQPLMVLPYGFGPLDNNGKNLY